MPFDDNRSHYINCWTSIPIHLRFHELYNQTICGYQDSFSTSIDIWFTNMFISWFCVHLHLTASTNIGNIWYHLLECYHQINKSIIIPQATSIRSRNVWIWIWIHSKSSTDFIIIPTPNSNESFSFYTAPAMYYCSRWEFTACTP